MLARNPDLHGNAPDKAPVALLLVDVINDLEFPEGRELFIHAEPMAARLAAFKRRVKAAGIPAIYANDNFGKWQSDFATLVRHCTEDDVCGRPIARLLAPEEDDYFVLKPKHSAFFATPLETLLAYLGVTTLILTGLTTDSCVSFTATDAFLRDFNVIVPEDCVAAIEPEDHRRALDSMVRVMKVKVCTSADIDLARLQRPRATLAGC
jgi:nicotinamidase-related amidase